MSIAQSKIAALQAKFKTCAVLSEEYMDTLDSLLDTVSADAIASLESFEMPVYKSTGRSEMVYTITKSTKGDGKFQITRFTKTGALGDSQYSNMRSLISSEGLAYSARRVMGQEAEEIMQNLMEAESQYQAERNLAMA